MLGATALTWVAGTGAEISILAGVEALGVAVLICGREIVEIGAEDKGFAVLLVDDVIRGEERLV